MIKYILWVISCLILLIVHNLGFTIYTENFQVVSKGVTLSFVIYYILFLFFPLLFLYTKQKKILFKLIIIIIPVISISLTVYETNPLRSILLVISYLIAAFSLEILIRLDEKVRKTKGI
ncbi:hypothetical protein UB37_19685 [Photobacterium iliopiscarium]|jgi:hypothetical protein|uniref:Uncharacterized protein n=1 Tax=Photobacterium iliopiscarium TaxID=56192 RepID=A0ABX5GLV0_9GAMM|nr:hypothetical protein UB37_19685 [Photobacterium iliopiscarium]PSW88142.1 hypothetical protein C9J52_20515 [Photobacterium iliopiscarium]